MLSLFRSKDNEMNHDRRKKGAYHAIFSREGVTDLSLNILATNTRNPPNNYIIYCVYDKLREV